MAVCFTCMNQVALGKPWEPHKCALGYGTIAEKERKDKNAAAMHKRSAMRLAVQAVRKVFEHVPDEHREKVVKAIVKAAALEE